GRAGRLHDPRRAVIRVRVVRHHGASSVMVPRPSPPAPGPRPRARAGPPAAPPGEAVPFDYAATFPFKGESGQLQQDVISIGADAACVATAIGYGFDEDRRRPCDINLTLPAGQTSTPAKAVSLQHLPPEALISGFRLNADLRRAQLATPGRTHPLEQEFQ